MERQVRRGYRNILRHARHKSRRYIQLPGWLTSTHARAAMAAGTVLLIAVGGIVLATGGGPASGTWAAVPARPSTLPWPDPGASPAGLNFLTAARTRFRGIVLPDLLIVLPRGITVGERARLAAIKGVRNMISFDGAEISAGGQQVSVIGVNPQAFQSWVPLRTAENARFWAALAAGDFVASTQAASKFDLRDGDNYQLNGRVALTVPYGGSDQLGVGGIDLLVNPSVSRRLGLVRQVAALLSAPGVPIRRLIARVRAIAGPGAKIVDERDQRAPAAHAGSGPVNPAQITTYLQLFQASATKYCPGLSWTVLAAIGQIESADGQNMGPSTAGALGPMQFLPSTWAQWGIDGFGPAGPPDIWNPLDAVPSAARMLCADGASAGTQAGLRQAVFAYNHADWYVNEVLALAAEYAAEYR